MILYLFFRSLIPSTIGLLETDDAVTEGGVDISIFIFLSRKLLYFYLTCVTIRKNFLTYFAVRAIWNALQPHISIFHQRGQQLNLSQVSNKETSSVDKEKLLKKYFHRGYPYAALFMCASDCGSGCFELLWCISSLILGTRGASF